MNQWPKQSECDAFYGNPRGPGGTTASHTWQVNHLVQLPNRFAMHMGDIKIFHFPVHIKCVFEFDTWLDKVWDNADHDPKTIARWGMDVFSGSFNYRPMRGLQQLSMHAYGCAVDFDAPRNPLGAHDGHFNTPDALKYVVKPFEDLGGIWGGRWQHRPDPMHFQFAIP